MGSSNRIKQQTTVQHILLSVLLYLGLTIQVNAQELPHMPVAPDPETKITTLPMYVQCAPIAPDTMLKENYNELGMLDGLGQIFITPDMKTMSGKMRMFVDPDEKGWTIMLEVGPDLHCMVMSGEDVGPMVQGTGI